MTADGSGKCSDNISSYLASIINYNQSNGIDLQESADLFARANACGPDQTGNDSIQFAYQQITGIQNPDPSRDSRPNVSGNFVTRFSKNSPLFKQAGYFADGNNACLNFDGMQPREYTCEEYDKPVLMNTVSLRWEDPLPNSMITHHDTSRAAVEFAVNQGHGNNWRVLKDKMDVSSAFDFIKANMEYPDLVAKGILAIINGLPDPWDLMTASCDLMDMLIAERRIDPDTKNLYGEMLGSMMENRLAQVEYSYSHISDPIYVRGFQEIFRDNYGSYRMLIRDQDELANGWKDHWYSQTGLGMMQGIFMTQGFGISGFYIASVGIKAGWALYTGATIAALTPWFWVAVGVIAVAVIAHGAVYAYSHHHAHQAFEEQFNKKIERRIPPKPGT